MRTRTRGLKTLLLSTLPMVIGGTLAVEEKGSYLDAVGTAYHLALADVNGDGQPDVIYATFQGQVACLDPRTGQGLWAAEIGGFPFGLAAADIDGDGRPETLVACADGALHAFSAAGEFRWIFRANSAAMNQVVLCRQKDGPPAIVCGGFGRVLHLVSPSGQELARQDVGAAVHLLAAADVDHDGAEEILFFPYKRKYYEAFSAAGGSLRKLWRRDLPTVSSRQAGAPVPFSPFSAAVGDLDGDGGQEVVLGTNYGGGSRVATLASEGQAGWVSPPWRGLRTTGFDRQDMFSMTLVAVATRLPGSPAGGIVAVTQGGVGLYDPAGTLLGAAHAPIGFAAVAVDGDTLYLGSSPNGDHTIYRVDLNADWKTHVEGLRRHGRAQQIGETLAALSKQVQAYAGTAPANPPYTVRLNMYSHDKEPQAPASLAWFRERFPFPAIEPIAQCGSLGASLNDDHVLDAAGEPVQPLRKVRDGRSPEQLVAWARAVEHKQIRTDLHFDHECQPRLTHESLRRMIAASPSALRGFISHEDERFDRLPDYCGKYLPGVAELCAASGKELTMQEKNVWWFAMPSHPAVFAGLFAGGRGDVLAAGCDNANSRTPELNLLGRFGLRQAGLIGHLQMSAISDLFCWSRMREWEYPKHGHPYLRVLVAGCVLGADRFYTRMDNFEEDRFTDMAEEGVGLFLDMLAKGIVFAPRPDQMAGMSRVGFAVHFPSEKWFSGNWEGHAVDSWQEDPELDQAVIPHGNVVWGNTPTPEHALQAVLLHKRGQFGTHVPATPYGPFVFVPAQADLAVVPGVDEWWHTDGISVWQEGGLRLTGKAAADALRGSFETAAEQLPFRPTGDDVFFHTVELEAGHYRVFAIDPGWLDPADRDVTVRIQLAGQVAVSDLLSGSSIPVSPGRTFPLRVPAGALRIVDVVSE